MHTATVPLDSLTIHPATEAFPMPGEDDPASLAVVASVCEMGRILDPLKICKGRVVDGRLRMRGAKAAGLETVPVEEVAEEDVHTIIFHSLAARRHYTSGARAILAAMILPSVVAESRKRSIANLRAGNAAPVRSASFTGSTAEDVAERFGISRRLLFSAQAILKKLANYPELRAKWLGKILSGAASLEQIQQGLAGKITALDGKATPKINPQQMMLDLFKAAPVRLGRWEMLTPAQKDKVEEEYVSDMLEHLPERLLKRTERFLRERKAARLSNM